MTKEELIAKTSEDAGITKAAASTVLSSILNSIEGALANGDKVSLIGFGTFSVSHRAARDGRNPATGAAIKISAANVPKFKAGKKLKEAV
ncbi:HU family DNA-binding protein [Candidatus Latescibacterota bacterium]